MSRLLRRPRRPRPHPVPMRTCFDTLRPRHPLLHWDHAYHPFLVAAGRTKPGSARKAPCRHDNEKEAPKRFPTKGSRMNDSTLKAVSCECRRHPGPAPAAAVPAIPLVPVANSWTCTSAHAAQTQASTTATTASLGGSLFCSWTCPEQGSHSVVLDDSLFDKEQGGHTFSFEPRGAATA